MHLFAFQQGINRKSEKLPLSIKEKEEDVARGLSHAPQCRPYVLKGQWHRGQWH